MGDRALIAFAAFLNALVVWLLAVDVSVSTLLLYALALSPLVLLVPMPTILFRLGAALMALGCLAVTLTLLLVTPIVPYLSAPALLAVALFPPRQSR